jgi:hypothetical protein
MAYYNYSLQYNRFDFFGGINNAADFGIYPFGRGINLDLCLCTVPRVGLYRS